MENNGFPENINPQDQMFNFLETRENSQPDNVCFNNGFEDVYRRNMKNSNASQSFADYELSQFIEANKTEDVLHFENYLKTVENVEEQKPIISDVEQDEPVYINVNIIEKDGLFIPQYTICNTFENQAEIQEETQQQQEQQQQEQQQSTTENIENINNSNYFDCLNDNNECSSDKYSPLYMEDLILFKDKPKEEDETDIENNQELESILNKTYESNNCDDNIEEFENEVIKIPTDSSFLPSSVTLTPNLYQIFANSGNIIQNESIANQDNNFNNQEINSSNQNLIENIVDSFSLQPSVTLTPNLYQISANSGNIIQNELIAYQDNNFNNQEIDSSNQNLIENNVIFEIDNASSSNVSNTDANTNSNPLSMNEYKIIKCNPLKTKLNEKLKDEVKQLMKLNINYINENDENNQNWLNDSTSSEICNNLLNDKNLINDSNSTVQKTSSSSSPSKLANKENKRKTKPKKIFNVENDVYFEKNFKLPIIPSLSTTLIRNNNITGKKIKEKVIVISSTSNENSNTDGCKKRFIRNEMQNNNRKIIIESNTENHNDIVDLNESTQTTLDDLDANMINNQNYKNNNTEYFSINTSYSNNSAVNENSKQENLSQNYKDNNEIIINLTEKEPSTSLQSTSQYHTDNNRKNSPIIIEISDSSSDDENDNNYNNNNKIKCDQCKKIFINPRSLKIHNKRVCIVSSVENSLPSVKSSFYNNNNNNNYNNNNNNENDSNLLPPSPIDESFFEGSKLPPPLYSPSPAIPEIYEKSKNQQPIFNESTAIVKKPKTKKKTRSKEVERLGNQVIFTDVDMGLRRITRSLTKIPNTNKRNYTAETVKNNKKKRI